MWGMVGFGLGRGLVVLGEVLVGICWLGLGMVLGVGGLV